MKSLIVYFSHAKENYVKGDIVNLEEGNTKVVAKKIRIMTGADMFEILPLHDYPDSYDECTQVAKNEINKNLCPKIRNLVADIEEYDVIYLGYPNWWGTMPMIVKTFLEEHDFHGKIIYPFCTHEGSGLGDSIKDLRQLCPLSVIGTPLAIRGSEVYLSDEKIKEWLEKEKKDNGNK